MNTNPFSWYPKEEMMYNITKMNTNPSSGYHKEDLMDNITNINTNPSSVYPKEEMIANAYTKSYIQPEQTNKCCSIFKFA
jgi:hypothetical protein